MNSGYWYRAKFMNSIKDWDASHEKITIPTNILFSENDPTFKNPIENQHKLTEFYQNTLWVTNLWNVWHCWFVDYHEYNDAIVGIVKEVWRKKEA
jgi:hypothetical protein